MLLILTSAKQQLEYSPFRQNTVNIKVLNDAQEIHKMSFSNDSRYFCGGRLFTIFSFSQCLACLIAPCASALAWGYFSALIAKERITWLCSCWRWGSNPPEKKPSTPWFHSYPEHSLSLLVSSITSNLLTAGPQVGTCCVLPQEQGSLTSAGVFQLMVLSSTYTVQQSPEVLPVQFSLKSHGEIPIKCSLLQFWLEILETA